MERGLYIRSMHIQWGVGCKQTTDPHLDLLFPVMQKSIIAYNRATAIGQRSASAVLRAIMNPLLGP